MDQTEKKTPNDPRLEPVLKILKRSQNQFREKLKSLENDGGLTLERYIRYLSMQYHLTKNVQRPFLMVAGHSDLGHRRELRKFLVNFANEEEFHFLVAARDIEQLGTTPLPIPFDVELWWAYFNAIVPERPFVRLGATCILENISVGSQDVIKSLFGKASYLTPKNSVFFKIHQHDESLPHGDQILAALSSAKLEERHFDDLAEGALKGKIMYLRLVDWALHGDAIHD